MAKNTKKSEKIEKKDAAAAMMAELEALKAELAKAKEAEQASKDRIMVLEAAKVSGRQIQVISTFNSLCHALVAGHGKGYLQLGQLENGITLLLPLKNEQDSSKAVLAKARRNIASNILKQKDPEKGLASISWFDNLVDMVNKVIGGEKAEKLPTPTRFLAAKAEAEAKAKAEAEAKAKAEAEAEADIEAYGDIIADDGI